MSGVASQNLGTSVYSFCTGTRVYLSATEDMEYGSNYNSNTYGSKIWRLHTKLNVILPPAQAVEATPLDLGDACRLARQLNRRSKRVHRTLQMELKSLYWPLSMIFIIFFLSFSFEPPVFFISHRHKQQSVISSHLSLSVWLTCSCSRSHPNICCLNTNIQVFHVSAGVH